MSERTCAVDRCPSPHYGLGHCKLHYRRFKKHGSTDKPQREQRGCSVDGCGEKHYSVGFCQLHYNRQWRTGSTDVGIVGERTYICLGCRELVTRDAKILAGTPRWCADCRAKAKQAAKAKWHEANRPELITDYVCKFCGCSFCYIVPDGKPRTICAGCLGRMQVAATTRWQARNPEQAARYKATGHMKRRAAKKGADAQSVSRDAIYAAHGWHCYLCDKPIDPSLHHRDPMYGTVDHVVPLLPSDSGPKGTHSFDNLRPAHARCNRRKGNRRILRLI